MIRDTLKVFNYNDNNNVITKIKNTSAYTLKMRKNDKIEITLLVQGSYANGTNIRSKSDVDVAVILETTFLPKFRELSDPQKYRFIDRTYTIQELKDEVEKALKNHYGNLNVARHDKCIKVKGNTNRVNSDVVLAYRYRNYENDYYYNSENYEKGIVIYSDKGEKIINYPEKHIEEGLKKIREQIIDLKSMFV